MHCPGPLLLQQDVPRCCQEVWCCQEAKEHTRLLGSCKQRSLHSGCCRIKNPLSTSPIVPCHVTCCVHVCESPVCWLRTQDGRLLSLGTCSAFPGDREDPLPILCLKDGLSRRACSHHLSFLRQHLPSTACWGSPSSGFTASTLSGAFQLTSTDGVDLLLPTTRAQWQLVCEASLT